MGQFVSVERLTAAWCILPRHREGLVLMGISAEAMRVDSVSLINSQLRLIGSSENNLADLHELLDLVARKRVVPVVETLSSRTSTGPSNAFRTTRSGSAPSFSSDAATSFLSRRGDVCPRGLALR
jgi:D-arabinose 1-dehydrogenase-like Zn-dependent alcohol dehydrogenase